MLKPTFVSVLCFCMRCLCDSVTLHSFGAANIVASPHRQHHKHTKTSRKGAFVDCYMQCSVINVRFRFASRDLFIFSLQFVHFSSGWAGLGCTPGRKVAKGFWRSGDAENGSRNCGSITCISKVKPLERWRVVTFHSIRALKTWSLEQEGISPTWSMPFVAWLRVTFRAGEIPTWSIRKRRSYSNENTATQE